MTATVSIFSSDSLTHIHFPYWWRWQTLFFNFTELWFKNTEPPICKVYNLISFAAKSLQSCPTLCDPIDGSPTGSPVPGILQARTLEWVAISFSSAWKWKMKAKLLSRVRLLATPWTAAYQAPLSIEFSRQEYWSGVPLLSPKSILILYKYFFTLNYSVVQN